MDLLNKNSKNEQSEFKIVLNETNYSGLLNLIDDRIKITLTLGLSQFKWCKIYSIEDLYKQSRAFLIYSTIEEAYEYFKEIFRNNSLEVKKDGQKIILSLTLASLNKQIVFDIELMQEQINTNDAMRDINNQIINMQKEIEELKISQKSLDDIINSQKNENQELKISQKSQDQFINAQKNENENLKTSLKRQDEVINAQKNEIEELKNVIKQIKEEIQKLNKDQNQILQRLPLDSKILQVKDVEKIGDWIHQASKQMELKLVYRATTHGFQTSKFYEKCSNITPTLVVIETSGQKRFGGYTDLLWKDNDKYVESNPNKSFVFSLDLHKKYTSNETNCQHAIQGSSTYFTFGGGYDIVIYDNSNISNKSYVSSFSYGRNEGMQKHELNGGSKLFQTREIEVFQVLLY